MPNLKQTALSVFGLLSFALASNAQIKTVNISFNSVFEFDTTQYTLDGEYYRFIDAPATQMEVICLDHDLEPDSSTLNTHIKNTVDKFANTKKDSAEYDSLMALDDAVIDIGKIQLARGFFGMYKISKKKIEDSTYFFAQFDTYNYDEHCYCEFKYKRSFYTDSSNLSDTSRINGFVLGLKTYNMTTVRERNQAIRDYYKIRIDTLPLENYWLHNFYKNGKMTRDTVWMSDLDSSSFVPRFTAYNITLDANLIIEPGLKHKFHSIQLKNMKSYEVRGDTIHIQLRDATGGMISRRGTIKVENELGYPIDIPFTITYRNHLYDKLRAMKKRRNSNR